MSASNDKLVALLERAIKEVANAQEMTTLCRQEIAAVQALMKEIVERLERAKL